MQMQTFAPMMFGGLIVIMLIGFPVAFSLSALGLFSGFIAIEMGWFPASFMSNLPLNVFGILGNEQITIRIDPIGKVTVYSGAGSHGRLLEAPADLGQPQSPHGGAAALQPMREFFEAVTAEDVTATHALLDAGADKTMRCDRGKTPAEYAHERGHTAVAELLEN